MKLFVFNDYQLGVGHANGLVEISDVVSPFGGPRERAMITLIEHFDLLRPAIEERLSSAPPVLDFFAVRLLAPIPRPENIVCMAVNYMEDGTLAAPPPINAFHKATTTVIGPGETMVLPDVPGAVFEGEAELALIIGKTARRISRDKAFEHIFGYTCFIDGSVRGLPPATNTFFQMKSRDTFTAMGPCIVIADEIADPQNVAIRLTNNEHLMQSFSTSDMAHPIARCLEWLSSIHTLYPGHVVATGTNHRGLNPFMDGDRIALTIEPIGTLQIDVRDDLKRQWARKTRLEHTSAGGQGPYTPQIGGKYAPQ